MEKQKVAVSLVELVLRLVVVERLVAIVSGQDIVGCGGFVQSTVPLNFERVEIKLYTKQGALKFKTECAPNNGYFLVAVYDKVRLVINQSAEYGMCTPEIFCPKPAALQLCFGRGQDK